MNSVHRVLDPDEPAEIRQGLCALAVMTKAPRAGRVKTRLSPPLTSEEAAALNVCFLRDTAAAIEITAAGGLAQGIGVYTPIGEQSAYAEILPATFELVPQRGDLFGERLTLATEDLLRIGFNAVCLIDSDSPTVPQAAYSQAASLLAQSGDRVVLGPSHDGGYYLIGIKQAHRRLFQGIDWSTERVAEQTMERASELGLPLDLLPTWYDVDDRVTLRRLCDELLGGASADRSGFAAPATRSFLMDIVAREGRERIWPRE